MQARQAPPSLARFLLDAFVMLLAFVLLMLAIQTGNAASPYDDCPPGVETAFRQLTDTMRQAFPHKATSRPCDELREEFLNATDPDDIRAAGMNAIGEGCW